MIDLNKLSKDELTTIIDNYVVGFKAARNKEIIKDHLLEGMTFEEVAEKHDMSVRQVNKIYHDGMVVIKSKLIIA